MTVTWTHESESGHAANRGCRPGRRQRPGGKGSESRAESKAAAGAAARVPPVSRVGTVTDSERLGFRAWGTQAARASAELGGKSRVSSVLGVSKSKPRQRPGSAQALHGPDGPALIGRI